MMSLATADQAFLYAGKTAYAGSEHGSRDGASVEAIGCSFKLTSLSNTVILNPERKISASFMAAEFLWYLSGADEVDMLATYAPKYVRFANEGRAYGAYGKRWVQDPAFELESGANMLALKGLSCKTQISTIITLLRKKPDTRQAILSMWNGGDLIWAVIGSKFDLPCTVCLQFLLRDNKLHVVTFMRSNDVWLGLPHDVFAFTGLQRLIAWALGVETGTYTHCVGSLHVYERDRDKMALASVASTGEAETFWDPPKGKVSNDVQSALEWEKMARQKVYIDSKKLDRTFGERTFLNDLVRCCACRWSDDPHKQDLWPRSEALGLVARREWERRQ